MERIALIIVNYNTFDLSIKCVNSILENCSLDYKIILVDNKSTNESYAVLSNEYKDDTRVLVVEAPENRGYSAGLNYGYEYIKSENYDYYAFLNNDLLFKKGTIETLVNTFDVNQNIGVVGGKVVGIDGKLQNSYKYLLTFRSHLLSMKPFYYFTKPEEQKDGYDYNQVLLFDGMVAGCCFVIPNNVMKALGCLDDEIFIYFEEDSLAQRIKKMNLKCALNPDAEIVHLGSQTISSSAFTYYNRYKSALYVLAKYCDVKKYQLLIIYMIYKGSFVCKLSRGTDYRRYYDMLRQYYKKLLKEVYK